MSACGDIAEIVRHCDVQFLDTRWAWDAAPDAIADDLYAAVRAEVLAEAAEFVDNPDDCDCGGCDTCVPRRLAEGLRDLAEEKASAAAPTATPDFFQPGHTYTEPGDTTDWRFRCDSITAHPEDGERTALGWRHFRGEWEPYAYGEDDFEIHQLADHINATTRKDRRS
jgi:hypothetical protein